MSSQFKKSLYFEKLVFLFSRYSKLIIVQADNVGSTQIQKCRKALMKSSILIMGKNTIIKKVLKKQIEKKPPLNDLYSYIKGNIGIIFTTNDPHQIRKILKENKIPAPARIGQVAQNDVIIPAGPTEITPDGTSFFQALNISTKIQRGQIEIQDPIKLIEKGKIIRSSEAALLKKLNVVPFSFELQILQIFDTDLCYGPSVLDITNQQIIELSGKLTIDLNSVSFSIRYPIFFYLRISLKIIFSALSFLRVLIGSNFK